MSNFTITAKLFISDFHAFVLEIVRICYRKKLLRVERDILGGKRFPGSKKSPGKGEGEGEGEGEIEGGVGGGG